MSSAELGALKISTAKLPEHQQPPGDLLNLQRSKNRCSRGAGDLALVVQEMGTHLLGLLGQQRAALAPFCRAVQTPSTSTPFPRGRKGCGLRARSVWRSFCLGAKHWHPKQGGWVPPCHRLRSPAGLGDPILRRAASRGGSCIQVCSRACAREGGANIGKSLPRCSPGELRPWSPRAGLGCHRYRVFSLAEPVRPWFIIAAREARARRG